MCVGVCTCVDMHVRGCVNPYFPCMAPGISARIGHALNNRSSRAHVIFTVEVFSTSSGSTTQLTLVDLAGSERIKETESTGRDKRRDKFECVR